MLSVPRYSKTLSPALFAQLLFCTCLLFAQSRLREVVHRRHRWHRDDVSLKECLVQTTMKTAAKKGLASGLWLSLCVLFSAPGSLYALVKSIPGFLGLSEHWSWVLSRLVALFTAGLINLCLPLCGKQLCALVGMSEVELSSVGKLIVAPVMPMVLLLLLHADCFGLWTAWWAP
eukprot:1152818-Amphidinium_carterae.1